MNNSFYKWLSKNYEKPTEVLLAEIVKRFNKKLSKKDLNLALCRARIYYDIPKKHKGGAKRKYNIEFYEWLSKNYKGTRAEVLKAIKAKFGYDIPIKRLSYILADAKLYYNIPKLKTGSTNRKKHPIGYVKCKNNELLIKVAEKTYRSYARYLYEQVNGKIPDDYIVVSADGDNKNIALDNLIAISKQQSVYIRANGFKYSNKEELKTLCLLSDLATIKPHYIRPSRRKENVNAQI